MANVAAPVANCLSKRGCDLQKDFFLNDDEMVRGVNIHASTKSVEGIPEK